MKNVVQINFSRNQSNETITKPNIFPQIDKPFKMTPNTFNDKQTFDLGLQIFKLQLGVSSNPLLSKQIKPFFKEPTIHKTEAKESSKRIKSNTKLPKYLNSTSSKFIFVDIIIDNNRL